MCTWVDGCAGCWIFPKENMSNHESAVSDEHMVIMILQFQLQTDK